MRNEGVFSRTIKVSVNNGISEDLQATGCEINQHLLDDTFRYLDITTKSLDREIFCQNFTGRPLNLIRLRITI